MLHAGDGQGCAGDKTHIQADCVRPRGHRAACVGQGRSANHLQQGQALDRCCRTHLPRSARGELQRHRRGGAVRLFDGRDLPAPQPRSGLPPALGRSAPARLCAARNDARRGGRRRTVGHRRSRYPVRRDERSRSDYHPPAQPRRGQERRRDAPPRLARSSAHPRRSPGLDPRQTRSLRTRPPQMLPCTFRTERWRGPPRAIDRGIDEHDGAPPENDDPS